MKTVIAAMLLFVAFMVCYEKEMFVLSYTSFGLSLVLWGLAIYRGHKTAAAPGDGPACGPPREKDAG